MRKPVIAILVGLTLLAGVAREVRAQVPPLAVQGRQDVSFGELIRGVPTEVAPGDPLNSGWFRIRLGNRTVQVSFILPGELTGPGGAGIPLDFVAGHAAFSPGDTDTDLIPFDPSHPAVFSGNGSPWTRVYLGGRATPPSNSPVGIYSGSIVLVVADLGS